MHKKFLQTLSVISILVASSASCVAANDSPLSCASCENSYDEYTGRCDGDDFWKEAHCTSKCIDDKTICNKNCS